MPQVYIDPDGAVRSTASGNVVAEAGTTPRQARIRAALWAAAADALQNPAASAQRRQAERMASATPITAAPSYARTVSDARRVLTVIDIEQLADETAHALAALAEGGAR